MTPNPTSKKQRFTRRLLPQQGECLLLAVPGISAGTLVSVELTLVVVTSYSPYWEKVLLERVYQKPGGSFRNYAHRGKASTYYCSIKG